MADSNAKELCSLGDRLFSRKNQLDTLHQTLAQELYPERASFTKTRVEGEELVEGLYTSLPAQHCRSLSEALGALTRPRSKTWFEPKAQDDERNTQEAKDWFSFARDRQRTLLYTRKALFLKTFQVADRDFVTFGNAVVMLGEDADRNGLMVFLPCHLRDCAWAQDCYQQVNVLHRKFKKTLRNCVAEYGLKSLSEAQKRTYEKSPYEEIELRHCVMPNEDYDAYLKPGKRNKEQPFVSVYINPEAQTIIKEGGAAEFPYHVRRWFLDDQSAYGYSPAAMLGLVEARLLQSQERVIMDAGERVVDPPSIAVRDAILGQVANYAGATTWVNGDYDERTGDALRYIETKANLPIGLEMKQDTREILAACMYINKLTLPQEGDMTAFEVNERIDEYIRTVGPAVEPFEVDNANLLDTHFSFCLRVGQFGPPESIPPELQGADVVYEFDGPLQLAYRRQKLNKAKEMRQFIFEEVAVRPDAGDLYDFDKIDRDAAGYIGAEPGWLRSEDAVAQARQQKADALAAQQQKQDMAEAAMAAKEAIQTVPAAAEATRQLPDLMKGLGLEGAGAPVQGAQGAGGQSASRPPQGGGYLDLMQGGDDEGQEATEQPQTQQSAPMPSDTASKPPEPAPADEKGIEDALRELTKVLSAKNVIDYGKDGKPTGWHRQANGR